MLGPVAALVVGVYAWLVAVQREPALDGEHVAGIAVDVHILRIQRHDVDDLAHIVSSSSFRCFCFAIARFRFARRSLATPASATSANFGERGTRFQHGRVRAVDVLLGVPEFAFTKFTTDSSRSVLTDSTGT